MTRRKLTTITHRPTHGMVTRPRSAAGNMSRYRCVSLTADSGVMGLIPSKVIDRKPQFSQNLSKKKGHNSVTILWITPFFKIDLYLMLLDSFVSLNEIDASFQELLIGNQKCENADDDGYADNADRVTILICLFVCLI